VLINFEFPYANSLLLFNIVLKRVLNWKSFKTTRKYGIILYHISTDGNLIALK